MTSATYLFKLNADNITDAITATVLTNPISAMQELQFWSELLAPKEVVIY